MNVIEKLQYDLQQNIQKIFQLTLSADQLIFSAPPDHAAGDYAFGCFGLAKMLSQSPAAVAENLAKNFVRHELVSEVKNIGPYLNLFIQPENFIKTALEEINQNENFGRNNLGRSHKILLEFSGPNTNKPQHLGHVRNNLLGQALVNIFRLCNYQVVPVNIVNDRGIHIVKSMLAWKTFGQGETPESSGIKGDHLVGKYYVKFAQELKIEQDQYYRAHNIDLNQLTDLEKKKTEAEFLAQSKLMAEAQAMLLAWEKNDPEVRQLWKMMNTWVYHGFAETYQALGISFDRVYYESDVYLLGKELVNEGLVKNIFFKKPDNSIWVDLTADGLDQKLLLRGDGTAVYMTQDLGMAKMRYEEYHFDQGIYIVGSEQNYHFQALFLILKKLGFHWAKNLKHVGFGMVNLTTGKMKSREGTVVDADDLIQQMLTSAQEVIESAEKKVATDEQEKKEIIKLVAMGALKFYLLGTNPQKDITFIPQASISFDGYTGTFLQYTHARINNILIKAADLPPLQSLNFQINYNPEEIELIKTLLAFPEAIIGSAQEYNPSILTQYLFELAKNFNNFYQRDPVLQAANENLKNIRLYYCQLTRRILSTGLHTLGIVPPKKM